MLAIVFGCGFQFACTVVEFAAHAYDPATGETHIKLGVLSLILHCVEWFL